MEFTKQEISQIKPRIHEEAKIQGLRNALLWRFKMTQIWNRTTTSFLDFSRIEHAQATHEHTEQLTTQLGSVSFVDAIISDELLLNFSDNL